MNTRADKSAPIGPRVIEWQMPGSDPWDNPGARQASPDARVISTGEERQQPLMIRVCLRRATLSLSGSPFMPAPTDALFPDKNGTLIAIEVSAGAKSDLFPAGYNPWRKTIGCRVASPATEGKANKAIIALVSTVLGVPRSSVSIVAGQTSPVKKVLVSGLTPGQVAVRLNLVNDS